MMHFRRALAISVLAALVLYAGSSLFTGAEDVLGAVSRLDARVWMLVLGLSLLNYSLRFCRWQWYLARLGHVIPPLRHLAYYVAGFAFTTTPGKVGEAIRSIYLRPHGVSFADSLAAFFVERFLDLLSVLLLGMLIARLFSDVWWPSICAAVLVVAILAAVVNPRLRSAVTAWLGRSRSPRVQSLGAQLHSLMRSSEALLSPRMLLGGVALGLVAWTAEGTGFYLILRDLDVEVSAPVAIGVYAAGMLIGALSFIPGGLGSTEAAMVLMLTVVGVEVTSAIAATIVCRVATLWFAVALGFGALAYAEAGRERTLNPG
jgi:uncharacterized protein (TIRG00374 family)